MCFQANRNAYYKWHKENDHKPYVFVWKIMEPAKGKAVKSEYYGKIWRPGVHTEAVTKVPFGASCARGFYVYTIKPRTGALVVRFTVRPKDVCAVSVKQAATYSKPKEHRILLCQRLNLTKCALERAYRRRRN